MTWAEEDEFIAYAEELLFLKDYLPYTYTSFDVDRFLQDTVKYQQYINDEEFREIIGIYLGILSEKNNGDYNEDKLEKELLAYLNGKER
jgi:ABC-type nitrate/sulfonate/bicarbonate transport system substrate-binding protein